MPMFKSKNTIYPLARVHLKKVFKLKKLHQRRAEVYNHIAFIKRCLKEGVNPRGLKIKIKVKSTKMVSAKLQLEKLQLKEQLNSLFIKMKRIQKDILNCTTDLVFHIRPDIWIDIKNMILQKEEETFEKIRVRHFKKFAELVNKKVECSTETRTQCKSEDRVVNLSNYDLKEAEISLLNYGLKQKIMTNKLNKIEIAIDTEIGMSRNKLEDNTIPKIVNKILLEKDNNKLNISKDEEKAMHDLRNNNEIVILRADKGYKTVVMNMVDYERKLDEEVYSNNYTEIENNPADKIEKNIRSIIGKIGKKQKKELKLFNKIYTCYNRDPLIFAQPKIHKPGVPLRPIISSFNTVLSNAAKFITPILNNVYKNMEGNNLEILNIYDLKKEINATKGNDEFSLISFDIVNMYGSIQTDKAFHLIKDLATKDKLFKSYSEVTLNVFLDILKLVLMNSYFKYKEKFFKQIQGLPMGSPTSPSIAKIYVQGIEIKFHNIPEFEKVKFIKRYMDDYICKWSGTNTELEVLIKKMNELDDKVKFTCEKENNYKINFLDASIKRTEGNKLEFSMASKDHDARIVLPGNAFQDEKTKRTVIQGETTRVLRISDSAKVDLNNLECKLINNHYNIKQVKRNMNIAISKENKYNKLKETNPELLESNKTKKEEERKEEKHFIFRYMGKKTKKIEKKFKRLNLKIINKKQANLENYFAKKVKYSTDNGKGIIYKIPCECKEDYIGETGFNLKKRVYEHSRAVTTGNMANSLSYHHSRTGHNFQWHLSNPIDREFLEERREVREALYIQNFKPEINLSQGKVLKHKWENIFP